MSSGSLAAPGERMGYGMGPWPRSRVRGWRVLGWALLIAGVGPAMAHGHQRSVSYSTWRIDGKRAEVTVRLSELDVSRFPWAATAGAKLDATLGSYLARHLQLFTGETACAVSDGPRRLAAVAGRVAYEWRLTCPRARPLRVVSELLIEVAPSHLHFARVHLGTAPPLERVLAEGTRSWGILSAAEVKAAGERVAPLRKYVALGVEQILSGYDHLAFMLVLLLLKMPLMEVARVVTGFTVGHSLTLGLAALGYVRPERAAIEALIGLSVALVAAEDAWILGGRYSGFPLAVAVMLGCLALGALGGWGRVLGLTLAGLALFSLCYLSLLARVEPATRLRWGVAFLFGLVHGFGFAVVLAEAHLAPNHLVPALLGFNAGVEMGELGVVVLIWAVLPQWVKAEKQPVRGVLLQVAAAAVCGLGVFWFVSRAYG